jgi:hypothetical protein
MNSQGAAGDRHGRLELEILPQPDDYTCGPTCLHAVYRYYGMDVALQELIEEVRRMPSGGTADVFLANDALRRGMRATICTYNLRIFDPTWFDSEHGGRARPDLAERLQLQRGYKAEQRPVVGHLTDGYLEYLSLGGELRFVDLSPALLRKYLRRGVPILTGLCSTYLYHHAREFGDQDDPDDVRGEPQGHFVVLSGYRPDSRTVSVADPYEENPLAGGHHYDVSLERAVGAIMLGVLTHDANLLLLEPRRGSSK